jgi:hypothetical protein
MGKKWAKPPCDKLQVLKREKRYNHLRKKQDYKNNNQYVNLNKNYKKLFDVDLPYQYLSKVKQYISTGGIYKGLTYLINHNLFEVEYDNNRKIVPSKDVEMELFRREMCAFKDLQIWKSDISKRKAKSKKPKKIKFYLIINGKKEHFGSFPENRSNHAKKVAHYLLNNKYIFDTTSPYYFDIKDLRKIINRYFQTNKFLNTDFKYLIDSRRN